MSGIKGKNTRPEITVRSALHGRGFRFRLHGGKLPGKPDLVFAKYRAVLFVHGCFWHQHDCHLFKWPKTRTQFWRNKIGCNVERDRQQVLALQELGWRVGIVWECALKGRTRLSVEGVADSCAEWLQSDSVYFEVKGYEAGPTG